MSIAAFVFCAVVRVAGRRAAHFVKVARLTLNTTVSFEVGLTLLEPRRGTLPRGRP
jgi:hypothetical protein